MTRVIPPPALSDEIMKGHSQECLSLGVSEYPDLFAAMQAVSTQALAMLEGGTVMEQDMALACKAKELTQLEENSRNGEVLNRLRRLMQMLRLSPLSKAEKMSIWQPIAECYASVVNTLSEKITPLEERELVSMGSIITAPVTFVSVSRFRGFFATVELPKFQFAAKYNTRVDDRYPLKGASFLDSYLNSLPTSLIRAKFGTVPRNPESIRMAEFTIGLPLIIVSPLNNDGNAIVEIPEGALEAALMA